MSGLGCSLCLHKIPCALGQRHLSRRCAGHEPVLTFAVGFRQSPAKNQAYQAIMTAHVAERHNNKTRPQAGVRSSTDDMQGGFACQPVICFHRFGETQPLVPGSHDVEFAVCSRGAPTALAHAQCSVKTNEGIFTNRNKNLSQSAFTLLGLIQSFSCTLISSLTLP